MPEIDARTWVVDRTVRVEVVARTADEAITTAAEWLLHSRGEVVSISATRKP